MFKKVLIANRGEIAVRLITACKELGIKTYIIHSKVDEKASFVNWADHKILIEGAPIEAYLNYEAIINQAKKHDIEAIHPGYGFLSENHHFAKACHDNGITFIGPNYEVIRQMGSKIEARSILAKANVPMVPGLTKAVEDIDEVKTFASQYKYPIACKASGGGGGRGFAIINNDSEIADCLKKTASESLRYFGVKDVYLEKYFAKAKHIEVQIMADNYGNVITLGERDCSTQRRHQKLIEESPASSINPKVREKLHATALKIAKSINYNNIGTIEFLVADDEIYFLEVNSRIQVEHPVTEVTTGIDIAKEQIKLSFGEKLSFNENIKPKGHGLEFRITAENPYENFMPNFGMIEKFHPPSQPFLRVDTHCHDNFEVLPFYDSLLAKLIVWGADRNEAINKARLALKNFSITGINTSLDFFNTFIDDELFKTDKVYTAYVENIFMPDFKKHKPAITDTKNNLAIEKKLMTNVNSDQSNQATDKYRIKVNEEWFDVEIVTSKNNSKPRQKTILQKKNYAVKTDTEIITVKMPGLIKSILVKEGDSVTAGQKLLTVEAMKMESDIVASHNGCVTEIMVEANQTVQSNTTLMTIKIS